MDAEKLKKQLIAALGSKLAISVPFPPCADVMLSRDRNRDPARKEEIDQLFFEYFELGSHSEAAFKDFPPGDALYKIHQLNDTATSRPNAFLSCLQSRGGKKGLEFPPEACLSGSCITLAGHRGRPEMFGNNSNASNPVLNCKRMFAGDLVWLFYFERMGIFKMLGAVLDDFVTKGKYPFPNDDLNAVILEAMARQTKTGLSSTVRDRDSSYRRCLGWTSDVGRKLGSSAKSNTGFSNHFHKFLGLALTWYNDRRLAQAIQSTNEIRKSVATLAAISETLKDLFNTLEDFKHGRNYTHTLSGIVWCVSGLTLIRDLRGALGIASNYSAAFQYIPAAYDLLVKGVPPGATDRSHYSQHIECASSGRDILIDLEFLKVDDTTDGPNPADRGELTVWLDVVEPKIERYRTAYQGLTGVNLGAPGTPTIEQQA